MTDTLKIALVQMFSKKGSIEENLAETSRYIEEAEKRGIDIIAFPEASITGYNEPARFPHAVVTLDGPEVTKFVKMTEGKLLTALAGIIENNPDGLPFITHIIARNGTLINYYRKMNILDEDNEWFSAGKEFKVFTHDDQKFGIAICSDISMEKIFEECSRMGAKLVFELAAPGLYGERNPRDWKAGYEWWEGACLDILPKYAMKYDIWIPVATQAGATSDEDFPGGGYLFDLKGNRVYATKNWNPCVAYLKIDLVSGDVSELPI